MRRGRVTIASLMLFTVGEFILVALGFALPNWRNLTIAAGAFNAAALLLFPAIPESARWLLSKVGEDWCALSCRCSVVS